MFGRRWFGYILLIAAFLFWQPRDACPAEPVVEVPTASSTSAGADDSTVFALPHIPLSLSLSTHGGYDDNFRTSQPAKGSWFTNEGVTLTYDSPGKATHLNLRSGADLTYYPDQSGGQTDNINTYISASLVHNVSTRLKLDANVYATYRTEPDFGSNVGADSRQGNFFHTLDSFSARYDWFQRFSTVTDDKFVLVHYENSSSLDRFQNTIGQELRYDLLHKGNTVVAEYRFEIVDYSSAPRDSLTHFALLGLDQDFTPDLKLTVRGGATFRSFTQSGRDQTDPSFEGSLTYSGAHHSSLAWKTSYGVEEPSSPDVLSRTTFRTGLEFKYGITGRIIATANAYYHHDENNGVVPTGSSTGVSGMPMSQFSEDSFNVSVDLRYVMNRRFSFDIGFEHSEINSQESVRNYSRYRYFAGLTFTY